MATEIKYELRMRLSPTEYLNGNRPYFSFGGWEDIKFGMVRNEKYHGVYRMITSSIKFYRNAAKDIKQEFRNSFVNSSLEIELKVKNVTTQNFELLGYFKPDWKTYKEYEGYVEIELKEGGILPLIEANEDTKYTVGFQLGSGATRMYIDGIRMAGFQEWITADYKTDNFSSGSVLESLIPLSLSDSSGSYNEIVGNSLQGGTALGQPAVPLGQAATLFKINREVTLYISANINAYYSVQNNDVKLTLYLLIRDANGVQLFGRNILWQDATAVTAGNDRIVTITVNRFPVLVPAGTTAEIFLGNNQINTGQFKYAIEGGGSLRVETRFTLPGTKVLGKRFPEVFALLIGMMTNNQYTANTDWLRDTSNIRNGLVYNNLVLTSDDPLLADAGKGYQFLSISTSDLIDFAFGLDSLAMVIENDVPSMQPLEYCFQKDLIICDLGEISDFQMYIDAEKIPSNIKIGKKGDESNIDINGIDSPHGISEYKSDVKDKYTDKDYTHDVTINPFEIEAVRNTTFQKDKGRATSTDSNNLYAVLVNNLSEIIDGEQAYRPFRGGQQVSGTLFDRNFYNQPLTNGHSMARKRREFASMLYGISKTLKFQTTEKNRNIITTLAGVTINEGADVVCDAEPLFQPIIFEFRAQIPKDFIYLIQNKRYGAIRFMARIGGELKTLKGFMIEMGVNAAKNDTYGFKLLATPDNVY